MNHDPNPAAMDVMGNTQPIPSPVLAGQSWQLCASGKSLRPTPCSEERKKIENVSEPFNKSFWGKQIMTHILGLSITLSWPCHTPIIKLEYLKVPLYVGVCLLAFKGVSISSLVSRGKYLHILCISLSSLNTQ